MKHEWIKVVVGDEDSGMSSDEFRKLLQFLLTYKWRIEYEERELRKTTVTSSVHLTTGTSEVHEGKFNRRPWCCIHPDQTEHPIWRCKSFLEMTPVERVKAAREHQACYSCLLQQHTARNCPREFKCKIEGCGLSHHHLLHDQNTSAKTFHSHEIGKRVLLQMQTISARNGISQPKNVNVLWHRFENVHVYDHMKCWTNFRINNFCKTKTHNKTKNHYKWNDDRKLPTESVHKTWHRFGMVRVYHQNWALSISSKKQIVRKVLRWHKMTERKCQLHLTSFWGSTCLWSK